MIARALAWAVALAVAAPAWRSAGQVPPPAAGAPAGRILVMPFENVTRDSRIVWLGEACAVLMADDLNALGASAISRDERIEAFDALQVPPAATLTDATVIRIGQLVGAAEVVVGTLEQTDDRLTVRARSITLDSGRVRAAGTESGPIGELFATVERIARHLVPTSGRSTAEVERQHPALPAFEDYVKGLLAEVPSTQVSYLNAALKLEPGFNRARLALWEVYTEEGEHAQALAAVRAIPEDADDSRRARFLAGLSLLEMKRFDEAFSTLKVLSDQRPTAAVLNDLGVVQLRRGQPIAGSSGQPMYFFNRAIELDPGEPDYYFNLGYAYWLDRDIQAAIYWLREAVRRDTADGEAHYLLGAALQAAGNAGEASREKELARRLSSAFAQWDRRPANDAIPRGLERLKTGVELPHPTAVDAAVTGGGQRDQQSLAAFYLDRGRRAFAEERDREALADLTRALYLSPYDAEAHLLVGRIHLRAGRVREAIDALKIAVWSQDTADTHVALGEAYLQAREPELARAEAERALVIAPSSSAAKRLLDQLGPKP